MQAGSIQPGQNVVIIDDVIATGEQHVCASSGALFSLFSTGGSAVAAGELVAKQGGKTVAYLFMIEATQLNGRQKLDAPVYSIMHVDDKY